jgi:PAS domain S-box-containing protein
MAEPSSHPKAQEPSWDVQASSLQELAERLRETVLRYELIFKATNDVLYDLDLQKGTVAWNEALYTQYGYDSDEPAQELEWWTSHVHPDDALRLEREISEWFEGKHDTWQAEYRFRKADGSYVYVRDRGVVHRAPDGSPLRIIGSFLDITQQKQLERAKNEFISLASHQLRTPLTIIRLHSEMLTDGMLGTLSPRQTAHIEEITNASVRLIHLVDSILDVARAEMGHIVPRPAPHNVNKLLSASIKEVLPIAEQKGVVIHFTPNASLPHISLDTSLFGHIVNNLLTNAIRYTLPNKGVVKVSFARTDEGYLLQVRDNGIGIPRTAKSHVFGRFYRADNTANISEHGTGLGLYLTKFITEACGGTIWFESAKGKGTTFYVQFPPGGMTAV